MISLKILAKEIGGSVVYGILLLGLGNSALDRKISGIKTISFTNLRGCPSIKNHDLIIIIMLPQQGPN